MTKIRLDLTNDSADSVEAPPVAPIAAPAAEPARELVDPLSGECIPFDDVDGIIGLIERIGQAKNQLDIARRAAVQVLLDKTICQGIETKTRRVRGEKRRVKLTIPDQAWDQSQLKKVWLDHPLMRDELLRIDAVAVKMTELKKVVNEAGSDTFTEFVQAILAAKREPFGLPSVTIEE